MNHYAIKTYNWDIHILFSFSIG